MTIATRVGRLFRADMHGILDWLEEPEAVLKQAVRDMEAEIEKEEAELELIKNHVDQLKRTQGSWTKQQEELSEKIETCFSADNEELTKKCIRRKLENEQKTKLLAQRVASLDAAAEALTAKIADYKERTGKIKEKMELFVKTAAASKPETTVEVEGSWYAGDVSVTEEDVEVAYLRELEKRSENAES